MLGALGCGSSVSNESESTKSTVAARTTPATTTPPVETTSTTPAATAPQAGTHKKQTSFRWGPEGENAVFTKKDLSFFQSLLGGHGLPPGAYEVWAERHPKAANDVFGTTPIGAAGNAWHKGYYQQDENVYWKWISGRSCQDVQNGCWHVAVITRDGCRGHFSVVANEYRGGKSAAYTMHDQGEGIPARTPMVFELGSNVVAVTTADDVRIHCNDELGGAAPKGRHDRPPGGQPRQS